TRSLGFANGPNCPSRYQMTGPLDPPAAASRLVPKYWISQRLGKVGKFCRRRVLISLFTMPTFEVSELTARSAARPVGDVGVTPGYFYAHIKWQSPRRDCRGLLAFTNR